MGMYGNVMINEKHVNAIVAQIKLTHKLPAGKEFNKAMAKLNQMKGRATKDELRVVASMVCD